jgi:hypothetical protein
MRRNSFLRTERGQRYSGVGASMDAIWCTHGSAPHWLNLQIQVAINDAPYFTPKYALQMGLQVSDVRASTLGNVKPLWNQLQGTVNLILRSFNVRLQKKLRRISLIPATSHMRVPLNSAIMFAAQLRQS